MTDLHWQEAAISAGISVVLGLLARQWWTGRLALTGLTRHTLTGAPLPWMAMAAAIGSPAVLLQDVETGPVAVLAVVFAAAAFASGALAGALVWYAPYRFLPPGERPLAGRKVHMAFATDRTPVADVVASFWGRKGRGDVFEAEVVLREPEVPPDSVQGQPPGPVGPRHGRLHVRSDGVLFVERPEPGGPLALALWLPRRDLTAVAPVRDTVRFTTGSWPVPVVVAPEGTSDPQQARELAERVARRVRVELSEAGR